VTKISAHIPAYNVSEYLAATIEGLLSQTHPFDEILIIDDGSKDNSAEIASRYPQVTLIRHPQNKGLAAARNTAFHSARNELVASVDADVVADPNWIATLLPHMNDPKVAGAGGFLAEGVQKTIADRWRRARMSQEWGNQYIRNPTFLYGCNNIFRKSAIAFARKVGILCMTPPRARRTTAMTASDPPSTCTGAGGSSEIRPIQTASQYAPGLAMRFLFISGITFWNQPRKTSARAR
jgi:glycosyltransferase involved in cell wall biosynthesis